MTNDIIPLDVLINDIRNNSRQVYVLQGTKLHWKWSLVDYYYDVSRMYQTRKEYIIWGLDERNKRYYSSQDKEIKLGDIIFLRTNKDGGETSGIFGVGVVSKKFEDMRKYWPAELIGAGSWPYRLRIKVVAILDETVENLSNIHPSILDSLRDAHKNENGHEVESILNSIDLLDETTIIKENFGPGSVKPIKNITKAIGILEKIKSLSSVISDIEGIEKTQKESSEKIISFQEFIASIYHRELDIALNEMDRGKNIILYGPPGSGKTVLAKILAARYSEKHAGNGYLLYTVHSGTDFFDLVARITPQTERGVLYYKKEPRYLIKAILEKKVLILDEINRTQIDTALGIFFTYLEREHRMQDIDTIAHIIHAESGLHVDKDELKDKLDFFRIIGTLNVYDKTFLFKLGDALRRRFRFIEITTTPDILERVGADFRRFLNIIGYDTSDDTVQYGIAWKLFSIFSEINKIKELGIGILKDLILFSMNFDEINEAIEQSVISVILPFFENDIRSREVDRILKKHGLYRAQKVLERLNYAFKAFE